MEDKKMEDKKMEDKKMEDKKMEDKKMEDKKMEDKKNHEQALEALRKVQAEVLAHPPSERWSMYSEEVEELSEFIGHLAMGETDDAFDKKYGYKQVYQNGGGEGGSESVEAVFSLGGVFYRCFFSYASHEGYDYWSCDSTVRIVKPVTKQVVLYE